MGILVFWLVFFGPWTATFVLSAATDERRKAYKRIGTLAARKSYRRWLFATLMVLWLLFLLYMVASVKVLGPAFFIVLMNVLLWAVRIQLGIAALYWSKVWFDDFMRPKKLSSRAWGKVMNIGRKLVVVPMPGKA
jgi:hypothetical protein